METHFLQGIRKPTVSHIIQDAKFEMLQEKLVKLRIWWYEHVLHKDDTRILWRILKMKMLDK
jgi:hypothetical protein